MSGTSDHWGVLLLAHGAPERLDDIPEFLLNVRGGRALPDAAVQEIIHRYNLIGGGSPLLRLTNLQAGALAEVLNRDAEKLNRGADARDHGNGATATRSVSADGQSQIPVYVGMRNWKPYIADAVQSLVAGGAVRMVALCLAPQNSRTSVGLYRKHLMDAVEKIAPAMQVEFVESWHDHPGLIAAFQEKITEALHHGETEAGGPVPVIFTAHSVPEKTIAAGDPYDCQVRETAALVAQAMSLKDWRVAYQSQGMTADPWIGPTVESQIDLLAAAGHRHVLIAPVGFVCDHVEILYDIDTVFREHGRTRGVTVWRSESLNDSPLFIQALASIITARIGSAPASVPLASRA